MEELVHRWAGMLSLRPEQVQAALNALMQVLQVHLRQDLWQQLVARLPQAARWSSEAVTMSQPAVRPAGLPELGVTGGGTGLLLEELRKAGLSPDSSLRFVATVMGQIEAAAGPELYRRIVRAVPALGAALPSGQGDPTPP